MTGTSRAATTKLYDSYWKKSIELENKGYVDLQSLNEGRTLIKRLCQFQWQEGFQIAVTFHRELAEQSPTSKVLLLYVLAAAAAFSTKLVNQQGLQFAEECCVEYLGLCWFLTGSCENQAFVSGIRRMQLIRAVKRTLKRANAENFVPIRYDSP